MADLGGWSTDDAVLDERLICSNIYQEMARVQLNRVGSRNGSNRKTRLKSPLSQLRQCKTTESAIQALPYDVFRQEMLSYIANVVERMDSEPRAALEEPQEIEDIRRMQEEPEIQRMQGTQIVPEDRELNEEEAEEEEETQVSSVKSRV